VALAEDGRQGEVRFLGDIDHTPEAVRRLVTKLAGKYGPVTANVCKMAIGHESQIYQQLVCCCGRTVLRTTVVSLDTSLPGALGKEGRKA
jgi:hypothetical protein